nr:HAD family hydrolase [Sedimentibacter sp.]
MFKAAIFDLDGTLMDSAKDLEEACNYALGKFNLPKVNSQKYKLLLGTGRRKVVESIVAEFFENYDENTIEEFLVHYNNYYDAHMLDNTRPYEGILDMLDYLNENNILTAILSNKPDDFTKKLVSQTFGKRICYVSGLKEDCKAKPDPTSLLNIISKLKVEKNQCLYVGDTEIDIQTAKNAGIKSIGVLWGFRTASVLLDEGADYIVSTADEIKKIVVHN